MDRSTSQPRVEFRRADCVRSRIHGLGQVLVGGPTPVARLLSGQQANVAAGDLTLIANEDYAETIASAALAQPIVVDNFARFVPL